VSKPLRVAVIGVGRMGRHHARIYSELPDVELVAVIDADVGRAQEIATVYGCQALRDVSDLPGPIDAVSVAVPTVHHRSVAEALLRAGAAVLLEKPLADTVAGGRALVEVVRACDGLLQVGHTERFNPVVTAVDRMKVQPKFIETHRISPFTFRSADIGVVLDMMIHDIDIIQNMVGADIDKIDVNGVSVLTDDVDIANARLQFENGCVANVTASRVSMNGQRKMRIFQHDAYISIDFQDKVLSVHRKGEKEMFPGIPEITSEESIFESSDAIKAEIEAFLKAIREGGKPPVTGEDGRRALSTALRITEQLVPQRVA